MNEQKTIHSTDDPKQDVDDLIFFGETDSRISQR